ncbi:TlpA family protein disulfide reductase [Carboxylicivirga sp. N1Y90]|uniref:TlpA family protein disulfide reductase n=1 Tax=Carboxylicivirga fragile TaxID=3417571 RepID=UPI003D338A1F|nr:TlpA family protein disulfide reductase [Marinilabiliaceae bacterium N1Y90]
MKLKLILATIIIGVGFLSFMDDNQRAEIGLEIGNEAPGIQAELIDGTPLKLEDLKGKMVIINFWASYHAPSRMNNFYLNQLFEKNTGTHFHNGEELVVLSISLDRFRSPLNLAIEQDETENFKHICDFKGMEGDLSKLYNIDEPINILIDGDGRILAKDVGYSKIEKSLNFLSSI